jgi:hypothetical protein
VSAPRAEPGSTLTALAAAVLSTFSLGAPAARSANPSLSATPSLLKSAATSEGADAVGGANAGLTVAAATKRNESTTRAVVASSPPPDGEDRTGATPTRQTFCPRITHQSNAASGGPVRAVLDPSISSKIARQITNHL